MLSSGRLAIVEVVELGIAELLASPGEPIVVVERSVARVETAPGLGEGCEGKRSTSPRKSRIFMVTPRRDV